MFAHLAGGLVGHLTDRDMRRISTNPGVHSEVAVDVMIVKSRPGKKRESHLSRINHVNDVRDALFHRDGLAAQTIVNPL
jgi:hypothetical protein